MRATIIFIASLFLVEVCCAQIQRQIDSLKNQLISMREDTTRIDILISLNENFWSVYSDSALNFGNEALNLSRKIGDQKREALALQRIGGTYANLGDHPRSFEYFFNSLEIARKIRYTRVVAECMGSIGKGYESLLDYDRALKYLFESKRVSEEAGVPAAHLGPLNNYIGVVYQKRNQLDSAQFYMRRAFDANEASRNPFLEQTLFTEISIVQFKMGNYDSAFKLVHKNISINRRDNDNRSLANAYNTLAEFHKIRNNIDSALIYAADGLKAAGMNGLMRDILRSSRILAELHEHRDIEKALYYHQLVDSASNQLFGPDRSIELQKIISDEQERQRTLVAERQNYENRIQRYAFVGGIAILILISSLLLRNIYREKKAKRILSGKNELIEKALTDLKSTQTQLIHSEKMASLGELTAGIAHEIQNPLNFVNNFSELNKELLAEMDSEIEKGNYSEAKDLAKAISENQEKINNHGRRADEIVKGMLQHSRTNSGQKELTDLNVLADEYLRLAFHGLRAKDKSFNAKFETDFDPSLPKVMVVPQDIGRVILNLINNAFYAVSEKMKQKPEGYEPTVIIRTRRSNGMTEIVVKDNGNGIPESIREKIFQPFFTTKPTGQGTGLGLSLAYDIVKAHGGEIRAETSEVAGTKFIIQLPI